MDMCAARDQLEHLVDLWMVAGPSQKIALLKEKIRIENETYSHNDHSKKEGGTVKSTHP